MCRACILGTGEADQAIDGIPPTLGSLYVRPIFQLIDDLRGTCDTPEDPNHRFCWGGDVYRYYHDGSDIHEDSWLINARIYSNKDLERKHKND